MSTSNRTVFFEAAGAAALAAAAVALWSPNDVWLTHLGFHPMWIAVLVLAAHYGSLGLFLSLGLGVGALAVASELLGGSLEGLSLRATNTSDVFALAASLAVAWLAMLQERKIARLHQQVLQAERNHVQTHEALQAFQEHVKPLRARYQRIDLSVTMWRDLSNRIVSGDVQQAARAALDLGAIRSGATAGAVYWAEGNRIGTLARFGNEAESSDIAVDRTVRAAVHRRRGVLALEVEGATPSDSDIAAPIIDASGVVLGVIALRGVSATRLSASDVNDLIVVAEWLAPALAKARGRRRQPAQVVRDDGTPLEPAKAMTP
jgi:hypothetical protein